jgi:hypothetical protein
LLKLLLKDAPPESRAQKHQDEMTDDIFYVLMYPMSEQDDQERKLPNGLINYFGKLGPSPFKLRRYFVDKLLDHYLEDLPPTSAIVANRHQLLEQIMLLFELILLIERKLQK